MNHTCGPVEFHCPIGWLWVKEIGVGGGNWSNNNQEWLQIGRGVDTYVYFIVCVFNQNYSKSCITYGVFHLFSDQHPWLQEGDERGHFPEAVQEVSLPPASLPEGRAAHIKLSGVCTDGWQIKGNKQPKLS